MLAVAGMVVLATSRVEVILATVGMVVVLAAGKVVELFLLAAVVVGVTTLVLPDMRYMFVV